MMRWIQLLYLCMLGFHVQSNPYTSHLHSNNNNPSFLGHKSAHQEVDLGTTLIAIRYEGGVVVAADTRTSVGATYVSHRFAQKIDDASPHCVLLRSGSAADTQQLASDCYQFVRSSFYRHGGGGQDAELSVSQIAHWLRYQIRHENNNSNNNRELAVSLIVAGYDHQSQNGKIFSLFSSGTLYEEEQFAVSGSGSSYIIGFLDQEFAALRRSSKDALPTLQKAKDLCRQAIEGAVRRDGSSGGIVRMCVVTKDGIEKLNLYPEKKHTC